MAKEPTQEPAPPRPDLDATVVVATRNRAVRLQNLLTALAAQRLPLERFEVVGSRIRHGMSNLTSWMPADLIAANSVACTLGLAAQTSE